jgi:hypothetical protein
MRTATPKTVIKVRTTAKTPKTTRVSKKPVMINFATRLEEPVLLKLRAFTKKHGYTIASVTNSALRVYISEAMAIAKERAVERAPKKYITANKK